MRSQSFSIEFFPPKDQLGEERLWHALQQFDSLKPDFVSVTYGAGGSTRDRTINIASQITKKTGIPTIAHLTCVGSTKNELLEILQKYKAAGIKSILALRGDPTGGPEVEWVSTPDGLDHADELVTLAKTNTDFEVGVAAFPDLHPATKNLDTDIKVLLRKEKLGAEFATTQFFFGAHKWQRLVDELAKHGSSLPIYAGILPITNHNQLNRFAQLTGTEVPKDVADKFAQNQDDADYQRKLGIELATNLGAQLLKMGVPGLHFFTMNNSAATLEIARNLGFK
ncbi:MAG: methylenetetrahydrofolate reductase [Actinomycetota bacterium]|jgi:methylenetetrahydrofolate reductase (NADPH)